MLLQVSNLTINYGDFEAVRDFSFHIEPGELVSIIGANGAGKTTIIHAIMGLVKAKSGEISFLDENIAPLPAYRRAAMGIRLVPERERVIPTLTVYENLKVGAYGLKKKINMREQLEWIYQMFPILKERTGQLAKTLSGGEMQQLSISRALISKPKLLLVDEVSMGLMPIMVEKVFEILKEMNRKYNLSILLVEQNANASLEISDRAYVLETGSIVLSGSASDLIKDERVKKAFLGL